MVLLKIRRLQVVVVPIFLKVVLLGIAIPLNLSVGGQTAPPGPRHIAMHHWCIPVWVVAARCASACCGLANYLKSPAGAVSGVMAQWLGRRSSNGSV
jgi:hypothetical protein